MRKFVIGLVCVFCLFGGKVMAQGTTTVTPVTVAPVVLPSASTADVISTFIKSLKWDSGVGYCINQHITVNTETIKVLEYNPAVAPKNRVLAAIAKLDPALDVGYATTDQFIVGGSISLLKASDFGITIPILDLLKFEPMVSYSFHRINGAEIRNTKNDWIVGAKLVDVKF